MSNLVASHQRNHAQRARGLVADDVARTLGETPSLSVAVEKTTVRIVVDRFVLSPTGLFEVGVEQIIAEVADADQEEVMGVTRAWPVCDEHKVGLHAEVHNDLAVWFRRPGRHAIAAIGHLAAPERL